MKHKLILCLLAAVSVIAHAADYGQVARKASKYFGEGEWASAQALYELMLAERPDSLDSYAHAIVASALMTDTLRMTDLLERSSAHGATNKSDISVPSVRTCARAFVRHRSCFGVRRLYEYGRPRDALAEQTC